MVQSHLSGRADVHGGAQANRFKTLEDLDVFAGIASVVASLSPGWGFSSGTSIAIVLVAISFHLRAFFVTARPTL